MYIYFDYQSNIYVTKMYGTMNIKGTESWGVGIDRR
jgi:hypothetical protein